MRLAIADPPYLGRGRRWYDKSAPATRTGRHGGGGDHHPDAAEWDRPLRHAALIHQLDSDFDGWALACASDSLLLLASFAPTARVMVWHKTNAIPSGNRIRSAWEAVLVRVPPGRHRHGSGPKASDALTCPTIATGFVGAKPPKWTRWVLDALGYDPEIDDVVDLFPGSGAVTAAVSAGVAL